jgi:hypothetical protein
MPGLLLVRGTSFPRIVFVELLSSIGSGIFTGKRTKKSFCRQLADWHRVLI